MGDGRQTAFFLGKKTQTQMAMQDPLTAQQEMVGVDALRMQQDSLEQEQRLTDSMRSTARMAAWSELPVMTDEKAMEQAYEESVKEAFKNAPVMDSHQHKRKKAFMEKASLQTKASGFTKRVLNGRSAGREALFRHAPDLRIQKQDASFMEDWSAFLFTDRVDQAFQDQGMESLKNVLSEKRDLRRKGAEDLIKEVELFDPAFLEFESDEQFLKNFNAYYPKLCACANADKLLKEIDDGIMDERITRLKAKIETFKDIRAFYENRMQIMQSPYYALLLESDLQQGEEKYEKLKASVKDNEGARAYFDAVEKRKDLRFGKGMKTQDLLARHLEEEKNAALLKINLKDPNLQTVGGGTSKLYRLYEEDGSVSYVKKTTKVLERDEDPILAIKDARETIGPEMEKLSRSVEEFLEDRKKAELVNANLDIKKTVEMMFRSFVGVSMPIKNQIAETKDKSTLKGVIMTQLKELCQFPYSDMVLLYVMRNNYDLFLDVISYIGKRQTEYDVAVNIARIEAESTISDRNVCTSIMADRLGVTDLVAKSKTVLLEDETGRKVQANAMEEVVGMEYAAFVQETEAMKMKVVFSPEAIAQIQTMHVFDMVCGQIDRNHNNYMVTEYEEMTARFGEKEEKVRVVKKIKAIDNDLSFGNLMMRWIESRTAHNLSGFKERDLDAGSIKFLPADFVEKLQEYQDMEKLKADFGSLRSPEEVNALHQRILDVCKRLDELVNSEKEEEKIRLYHNPEELQAVYQEVQQKDLFKGVLDDVRAKGKDKNGNLKFYLDYATLAAQKDMVLTGALVDDATVVQSREQTAEQTRRRQLTEEESGMKQVHKELNDAAAELKTSVVSRKVGTHKDSKEMTAVKTSLQKLEDVMAKPLGGEAGFAEGLKEVQQVCQTLIDHCLSYEKKSSSFHRGRSDDGQRRLELVRRILFQCRLEYAAFTSMTQQELELDTYDAGSTWQDVLYGIRALKMKAGDPGVTVTGAGTSTLYRKQERDGRVSYIKEEESLVKSGDDDLPVDEFMERYSLSGEPGAELFVQKYLAFKEKGGIFKISYLTATFDFITGLRNNPPKWEADMSEEDYRRLEKENFDRQLAERVHNKIAEYGDFKTIIAEDEAQFITFVKFFFKKSNEYDVATGRAKIRPGAKISNRNVSTSRVAKKLKVDSLIASSQTVLIQREGEAPVRANAMEGVETKSLGNLVEFCKAKGTGLKLEPKALKQYFTLQVFDLICGQVDRNSSNIQAFYTTGEDGTITITSLKGIDNDMAFGRLPYKEADRAGFLQGLGKPGAIKIPFLPKDFYQAIMHYSAEEAAADQMDLRTAEERKALGDRLTGVQKELFKLVRAGEIKLVNSDEEWAGKLDTILQMEGDKTLGTTYLHRHELFSVLRQ